MNARAEQAKALIEQLTALSQERYNDHLSWIGTRKLAKDAAAALTASEAEVTRLETGINNAMALKEWVEDHGWMVPAIELAQYATTDPADLLLDQMAALSQPTTDTNGAHA